MISMDRLKACSNPECREVLPADPENEPDAGFWVKRREAGAGSRVLSWQSRCRTCVKRASRERQRRIREAQGKVGKERQRAGLRTAERDGRLILLRTCLGPCGRELECFDGLPSAFAVKERDECGRPSSYHAWCRECERTRAKEWREAHKQEVNERRRAVYADRMESDPGYREARREYAREQARRDYATSEGRARRLENARRWRRRERQQDPERARERDRMYYRARAEREGRTIRERGRKVIDGTRPELDALPFVGWLRAYQGALGIESAEDLAEGLGLVPRRVRSLLAGEQAKVSVDVVSRALTEARIVVSVAGRLVVTLDDLYGDVPLREKRRGRS